MSRVFPAQYAGTCAAECGRPIQVEEPVQFVDAELVHADCSGTLGLPGSGQAAVEKPCASCWMVHAGDCW